MSKIIDSLKKRIGRVKKTMQDFFISIYGAYIPLAFVFMIMATQEEKGWAWTFFICGLLLIIAGFFAMRKAWEELNKRQIEERKQRNIDMKLSGILIRQIIGLRQDFKNGGKKDDKSKPDTKPETPNNNTTK